MPHERLASKAGTVTVFPGDTVGGFKIERLVAYQGNPDCTYAGCTRRGSHQRADGSWEPGECFGWHCSLCDAPCSMYGHECPRAGDVAPDEGRKEPRP